MILIFGSTGTVGSEVVRQLEAAGAEFRRGNHKAPDFSGVDKVFLLSPSDAASEIAIVDAAKAAGVKHIVKLSVYGADEEGFDFARLHRSIEKAIERSGMTWTFVRPNGFMQNMHTYNGATIKSQGAFYGSAGDGRISHVDVRDIAAVIVAALTQPGHEKKAYTLSGPEALTYDEVAAKISAAAGRDVKYVDLPPDQLKSGMTAAGVPADYADKLLDLNRNYRENAMSRVTNDVKQVTGRDPISFDSYASDNAAAFR